VLSYSRISCNVTHDEWTPISSVNGSVPMYPWEAVGYLVLCCSKNLPCRKVFRISVVYVIAEILTAVFMKTFVICKTTVEMW